MDSDLAKVAETVKETMKQTLDVFQQLGPWCCLQIIDKLRVKLERYAASLNDCSNEEKLIIHYGQTQLRMVKKILANITGKTANDFYGLMHGLPDRLRLTLITLEQCPEKNEFSGVIFVEQRYIAKTLKVRMGARQYCGLDLR